MSREVCKHFVVIESPCTQCDMETSRVSELLAREIVTGIMAHLETHGHLTRPREINARFLVEAVKKTLNKPVFLSEGGRE